MRQHLIALLVAAAPSSALAADCPSDMSALKPHLAYQMQDYALPALPTTQDFLDATSEGNQLVRETVEQDHQHKLTFNGIYAVNDAEDVEVKKWIDELNKGIEMERILRCRAGK